MNLTQTIIHRCSVTLKLMLMFAETGDMRKRRPKVPTSGITGIAPKLFRRVPFPE
jgi:hypothetical protein